MSIFLGAQNIKNGLQEAQGAVINKTNSKQLQIAGRLHRFTLEKKWCSNLAISVLCVVCKEPLTIKFRMLSFGRAADALTGAQQYQAHHAAAELGRHF